MPPWWSPEQRFACKCGPHRHADVQQTVFDKAGYRMISILQTPCIESGCDCDNYERITADLETGAEVPA